MPQTYMNLSGEAVGATIRNEKIHPNDILVISDDMDLEFGIMRLKRTGRSAGHKGLRSIISCLGTSEFPRLKIGIGKNQSQADVVRFVLSPFDSKERPLLKGIIKEAVSCAVTWAKEGPDRAMTLFNR